MLRPDRRPPAAASTWVWSKGFASICDRRIPDEFPNGRFRAAGPGAREDLGWRDDLITEPEQYDDLRDGDVVWLRGTWIRSFVTTVLPRLAASISLVTGDCDTAQPSGSMPAAQALLDDDRILRWWTQNLDGTSTHPKLRALPIGLDLHTVAEGPAWGMPQATPAEQEAELASVAASLPPLRERTVGLYVDFGAGASPLPPPVGARLPMSRAQVIEALAGNPLVVSQPRRIPRREMWRRKGQVAASLSLPGNGLDCHRTWESLVLGQVVLVPGSSLDPVFEGTRVVTFDEVAELEMPGLVRALALASSRPDAEAPLTMAHWARLIRSDARR